MAESIPATPEPSPSPPRKSLWLNLLRAALFLFALVAFWNTLRQAELARAGALITAIGLPLLLVLAPYLVAMSLQTLAYGRIFRVLGRAPRFLPLLSVLLSSEAVLMSFPAGVAVADSINPYLLKRRCAMPVTEGLAGVAAKKSLIVLANALYMGAALAGGIGYLRGVSRPLLGFPGLEWVVLAATLGLLLGGLGMSKALLSGAIGERSHGLLSRVPSARLKAWLSQRKSGFLETDRHFEQLFRHRRGALLASIALLFGMWLVEGLETMELPTVVIEQDRQRTHELRAMGVPFTYAHGSIRLSLSRYSTQEEVDCFARINGAYNAWPYIREATSAGFARVGYLPYTLDSLVMGAKPETSESATQKTPQA